MIKFKTCEIMQYFEYYDVAEIAVIESRIKSLTNIKKYAIIIHDQDVLEDSGLPKKRHFHAILTFSNMTTSRVVAKHMHLEEQFINKIRTNTKNAMLYLVHRNNPEKYQYKPEDVVANFDYVEYVDWCLPKQNKVKIAERIANWEIKQYNLQEYISPDEFAKNKCYYDRCFIYRQAKMKNVERQLECLFITGASHTGKTTFAKQIATSKGYKAYVSSGGKNPMDNYAWEECIIIDDLRDDTYTLSDFLKLTDNNTDSLVHCRFYNKSIAECKLLIVTSVKPIKEFYKDETSWDWYESQVQLLRRFKTYMVMTKEKIQTFQFMEAFDDYALAAEFVNPVSVMFDRDVNNDFISWIQNALKLKTYEPPKAEWDSNSEV